jgi:hypothetical protein
VGKTINNLQIHFLKLQVSITRLLRVSLAHYSQKFAYSRQLGVIKDHFRKQEFIKTQSERQQDRGETIYRGIQVTELG